MHDLWGFLLQTLTVSLTAALLLALKAIFRDKLSPRWQYGVWLVLAFRALIPASLGGQRLLPLLRWVEWGRLSVERGLSSAYTGLWDTVRVTAPIPMPLDAPTSVTDWLFVLYTAGIVLALLWFLIGYLRLKRTLAPAPERCAQVERVFVQYGLSLRLPRIAEGNVSSAFVCGPLRPVLVLPRGQDVDDKVILHELLHLRYGDLWLNVLACLLRCLHWCNPFLWYVFNRVGNDAEALCDQRVLERLEGEERRGYGHILLSMADDQYARAPGTTSMANGGRRIKARIQSIARFKRYPQGMTLVSLCIVAILLCACLSGTAAASRLPEPDSVPSSQTYETRVLQSFAVARTTRPSTAAGALDCYAKAVIYNNAYYLSAVLDEEGQQGLYEKLLHRDAESRTYGDYYLDMGLFDQNGQASGRHPSDDLFTYWVINWNESKGTAFLVFPYETHPSSDTFDTRYIAHQVRLIHTQSGWLVETISVTEPALWVSPPMARIPTLPELDSLASVSTGISPDGSLEAIHHIQRCNLVEQGISNRDSMQSILFPTYSLNPSPIMNAAFQEDIMCGYWELRCYRPVDEEQWPLLNYSYHYQGETLQSIENNSAVPYPVSKLGCVTFWHTYAFDILYSHSFTHILPDQYQIEVCLGTYYLPPTTLDLNALEVFP